jgi:steroid 5-alpha reductase family enzyme
MTLWFVMSTLKKRYDIADTAWGLGFILVAIYSLLSGLLSLQIIVIVGLIMIWGSRLAYHIYLRNKNKPLDFRYKKYSSANSYFQVFLLQGFLMWLISFPVMFVSRQDIVGWSIFNTLGLLVWIIGFFFESVGDSQLKDFLNKSQNKGKIMDKGLWQYTRHPNYFGEVTMWWGIWLISTSSFLNWITLIGPITITILILFVSGVPLLEKKYQGNKVFEKYKSKTSVFIPWFPKK